MTIVLVLIVIFLSVPIVLSKPTVQQITLQPKNPPPLSNINFTAEIKNNESIEEVNLIVEECKEGFCYLGKNVSMKKTNPDIFQKEASLEYNDSTEIKYHLEIKTDNEWYKTDIVTKELTASSGDGKSDNQTNDAPGFEAVFILTAMIGLSFLIKKRKRYR